MTEASVPVVLEVGRCARLADPRLVRELARVARALSDAGVGPFEEPLELAPARRFALPLADDVAIAAVRRLAAHLWAESKLPAPFQSSTPEDAVEDPLVLEYYASYEDEGLARFWSDVRATRAEPDFEHLMLHKDDGGLYVPLAFDNPIELADGDLVGSAVELLNECETIAHALDLDPQTAPLDPTVQRALALELPGELDRPARWMRYGLETHTLLALCAGARAALASGAALELVRGG